MGLTISDLWSRVCGKKTVNILMVGLAGAGKTTILHHLNGDKNPPTVPTIGFTVETMQFKNFQYTVWDVGGCVKTRHLWKQMYQNWKAEALIFVVDSNDRDRFPEAVEELHNMLENVELHDGVILLFANKQDLPNSMLPVEVALKVQLKEIHVQAACALLGTGLDEGVNWLENQLSTK